MAAKTVETLDAHEVITKVLESLNPSDGGRLWAFSEIPLDGAVDSAICKVSETLGLNLSENDTMQVIISAVSYATLAEVGQHVLGIGSGIAKMDLTGFTLAQITKKLDALVATVDKLVREPLNSAKSFLKQAEIHLRTGNVERVKELLKEVNTNATKALNLLDSSGKEEQRIDDLVITTQLLILADVMLSSMVDTPKGLVILPKDKLTNPQEKNISLLVTGHLETLVDRIQKNKPSGLAKLLTLNSAQKKAANQDRLDQILKNCFPWLVPTTTTVDANTMEVTLPSLQLVPDGEEDMTHILVPARNGDTLKLSIWTVLKAKELKMVFIRNHYTVSMSSTTVTNPVLTITQGKIVKTNMGTVTLTKTDLPGDNWSVSDIRAVAPAVLCGAVTRVEKLFLYGQTYSAADIVVAAEVMAVAKQVFIHLSLLPASLTEQVWELVGEKCGQVELLGLQYGRVGTGCEGVVGRLVTRVGRAELRYVEITSFDLFAGGIEEGLGVDGGRCSEIQFSGSTLDKHRAEVAGLAARIGWRVTEDKNSFGDRIVIKK